MKREEMHPSADAFHAFLQRLAADAAAAQREGFPEEAFEWWDAIGLVMVTWITANIEDLAVSWGDPTLLESMYSTLQTLLVHGDGTIEERRVAGIVTERVRKQFPEVAEAGDKEVAKHGARIWGGIRAARAGKPN